jgi:hydrogenase/urease accessory protein HupE
MTTGRASRTAFLLALAAGSVLLPQAAHAHLVTTGLGPLYDGITHFLVSFEDLLPVIAMSLLAGLNGPQAGRRALFVLPAAWLLGGLAGYTTGAAPGNAWITAFSALMLGVLVAADRRLPVALVALLAAILGLLHGWLNGAGIAAANREALALLGIGGAVFVAVALLAALSAAVQAQATRIAVRVAGSWIAAIGLLMVGWQLKG